ncbi:MAG: hypothetical protein FD133_1067 [Erysipelotrichaceae bacterium]|nr:MAG: hypothetical protein FD179_1945 [Erysipelotrichaceae bacterium]TXT18139.1 MAG: hypothetical protein FD133_1067 [Erysipelotrichaceae bacterium]
MKRYFDIYLKFTGQHLKRMLQYRSDFLIGAGSFLFMQGSGLLFMVLVFQQIPDLNGWTLTEMMFLYGYFQLPRGLDHLLTDNIWLIPQKVRRGDIDRYLLRPINPLFQLIIERFQIEAFGELIVGVALMVITIPALNIEVNLMTVSLGLLFIILGSLIYTSIKLITASIGFWVINSMPIMTTIYNIADFSKYPTTIFPKVIQWTVTYLVPFAFVSFLPATVLLNRADGSGILLGSIIAVAILTISAYRLWVLGLKSYQSVGS